MKKSSQIKSKERVQKRGEAFTAEREVNAMLDLVADECVRPESRFLEPACGTGNFLVVILERKLKAIRKICDENVNLYERRAIVAIASLYGVEIMNDNVQTCRERLYDVWEKEYIDVCKEERAGVLDSVKNIIQKNIINGNMLSGMLVNEDGNDTSEPIQFIEWIVDNDEIAYSIQGLSYTLEELMNEENKTAYNGREKEKIH